MDKHLWEEQGREDKTGRGRRGRIPWGMALQRPQAVEGTDMMREQRQRGRGAGNWETGLPNPVPPRSRICDLHHQGLGYICAEGASVPQGERVQECGGLGE